LANAGQRGGVSVQPDPLSAHSHYGAFSATSKFKYLTFDPRLLPALRRACAVWHASETRDPRAQRRIISAAMSDQVSIPLRWSQASSAWPESPNCVRGWFGFRAPRPAIAVSRGRCCV